MTHPPPDLSHQVPKLCGADVELANFVLGLERPEGTGAEASRALLREIEGVASVREGQYGLWRGIASWGSVAGGARSQDWGRKFLPTNGGCAYIDLDHLEVCIPEVRSAHEHVAAMHAMLRIAREAQRRANAALPDGLSLQVLVNNSDGLSHSYGSHLSFLVTRECWENLFVRRLHHLLYLASFQASAVIFTGQGKVGAENGSPPADYQISQRADFFETLEGIQTTHHRPLVNRRDEALCGPTSSLANAELARLHVIFFDNTLAYGASLLKVGVMQIVLAMIEAGAVDLRPLLDDPLAALRQWSRDPELGATARLASGSLVSAIEHQRLYLDAAHTFAGTSGFATVPRADEILALWEDTLRKLEARDFAALAARLDWVLKREVLQRALSQRLDLHWGSTEIKYLDHLYSSLDEAEGLFWSYDAAGLVERHVTDAEIRRFVDEPPKDTRAWMRAMLLRVCEPEDVLAVDWDRVRIRVRDEAGTARCVDIRLDDPLGFGCSSGEQSFSGFEVERPSAAIRGSSY